MAGLPVHPLLKFRHTFPADNNIIFDRVVKNNLQAARGINNNIPDGRIINYKISVYRKLLPAAGLLIAHQETENYEV